MQIADELERRIRSGRYKPDRTIPSMASLMEMADVSRMTVRLAIEELRQRDLVFTVPHRGTFVKPTS